MACANPLKVLNKYYDSTRAGRPFSQKYFCVPCGYCLNCRVDKRNFLEDCCSYEYNKYGCGSFVTFTYDDLNIPMVQSPKDFQFRPTLSRDDVQKFLYRLRSDIRYHKVDNKLINPKFKMLYVGEYGDEFQRPHYHFIFFGLDWLACDNLFHRNWKLGIIDSLPIQDGCFRYVLKYLDKQVHGSQKKVLYDDNNVVAPFSAHSRYFGYDLFLKQLDYIEKHNYCYHYGVNDKPLNNYLKHRLLGFTTTNLRDTRKKMESYNVKKDDDNSIGGYSLQSINDFKHKQAKLREYNLYKKSIDSGFPSDIPISDVSSDTYSTALTALSD